MVVSTFVSICSMNPFRPRSMKSILRIWITINSNVPLINNSTFTACHSFYLQTQMLIYTVFYQTESTHKNQLTNSSSWCYNLLAFYLCVSHLDFSYGKSSSWKISKVWHMRWNLLFRFILCEREIFFIKEDVSGK